MQRWISELGGLASAVAVTLAIFLIPSQVQSELLNFKDYSLAEGLPQSQGLVVHQGPQGYIWVGTYGGLARYNGQEFQTYTTNQGLGGNSIHAITHDERQRLWVGTGAGVCRLDIQQDRFHCPDGQGLADAYVYTLLARGERLWVGTNQGLFRLQGDSVRHFGVEQGLPDATIQTVAQLRDGRLLVGTVDGLFLSDSTVASFQRIPFPDQNALGINTIAVSDSHVWIGTTDGVFHFHNDQVQPLSQVPSALENADVSGSALGQDDNVWFSTERGIFQWRPEQGFRHISRANGLTSNNTMNIMVDREGLIWIGHDDGISKLVPGPFSGYTPDEGLLHIFVRAINEDHQHRLWLGTREGVQVVNRGEEGWDFQDSWILGEDDGLSDPRVFAIDFPRPDEALIATVTGVTHWQEGEGVIATYFEADGLPNNRSLAVYTDSQDRTWIGTMEGVALLEDGEIRPPPQGTEQIAYPIRIKEDSQGRVWFGTVEQGAYVLLPDDQIKNFQQADGFTNETIWDLGPDENGGMWLASNGAGLFYIDAEDQIRRYTTEDGLVDNFAWQVVVDRHERVWVYSNRGLNRIEGDEIRHFGLEDGLLHLEGGATTGFECHTGDMWFGSARGLLHYDPTRPYPNLLPPPVVMERVEWDGEAIAAGTELDHRSGSLDFHFAALSFYAEDSVTFRYRLRGVSDNWSELSEYRPVTYGGLGGGDYVFEVEARNLQGVWSDEPARFVFHVQPPIWATIWFWLLVAPILIGLVWGGMALRFRQVEQHKRALEQQVRDRTVELQELNEQLRDASITDPLTGLKNRRYLVNQIENDVAQTRRAYTGDSTYPNRDIVFMMIDLDHFKEINDTYGHHMGDDVLRRYADIIHEQLRESDYVVRWGGEEFLVVARQTEASRYRVLVERLLEEARNQTFQIGNSGEMLYCTCSIGISHLPFMPKNPDALNWEQVVDLADVAVYMAKHLGRDGWVAIHGCQECEIEDGADFVRQVKTDLETLVKQGSVTVTSSYEDPLAGASKQK